MISDFTGLKPDLNIWILTYSHVIVISLEISGPCPKADPLIVKHQHILDWLAKTQSNHSFQPKSQIFGVRPEKAFMLTHSGLIQNPRLKSLFSSTLRWVFLRSDGHTTACFATRNNLRNVSWLILPLCKHHHTVCTPPWQLSATVCYILRGRGYTHGTFCAPPPHN